MALRSDVVVRVQEAEVEGWAVHKGGVCRVRGLAAAGLSSMRDRLLAARVWTTALDYYNEPVDWKQSLSQDDVMHTVGLGDMD